jgi:hypothetical protein
VRGSECNAGGNGVGEARVLTQGSCSTMAFRDSGYGLHLRKGSAVQTAISLLVGIDNHLS